MIYKGKKGGYVKASGLADPSDYTQNLEAAKILAKNGLIGITKRETPNMVKMPNIL